jgi:hypothetical protein
LLLGVRLQVLIPAKERVVEMAFLRCSYVFFKKVLGRYAQYVSQSSELLR